MNIMIIDDDRMLRKSVSNHLLEAGHTVTMASNGQEALETIEKNRNVDLLMIDVMMPVLTGPSLILMLKKYFPTKLPMIAIISGVRDGEEFLKKIDIQFDVFLPKPIDFKALHSLIAQIETTREVGTR